MELSDCPVRSDAERIQCVAHCRYWGGENDSRFHLLLNFRSKRRIATSLYVERRRLFFVFFFLLPCQFSVTSQRWGKQGAQIFPSRKGALSLSLCSPVVRWLICCGKLRKDRTRVKKNSTTLLIDNKLFINKTMENPHVVGKDSKILTPTHLSCIFFFAFVVSLFALWIKHNDGKESNIFSANQQKNQKMAFFYLVVPEIFFAHVTRECRTTLQKETKLEVFAQMAGFFLHKVYEMFKKNSYF